MFHFPYDAHKSLLPCPSPPASHQSPLAMQQSWLFLLMAVAVSPLATGAYTVDCIDGGGTYKANSTYEANLRRLAAILPAEISSSNNLYAFRGVGSWPNRPRAASDCYRIINSNGTVSSPSASSCAACIAGAFREAERACPYGKKVVVFGHPCRLSLAGFPSAVVLGQSSLFELLGPGLVLQAIGFAWLFFLLLQEWRDKRRRSMMRYSSVPSGSDQEINI